MEEFGKDKRQLIWGGLDARCSNCGWTTAYQKGATVHRLPDADRETAICFEFQSHNCEEFPQRVSS